MNYEFPKTSLFPSKPLPNSTPVMQQSWQGFDTFQQQSSSDVDKQLKQLTEQIKEIKSSQTNIYVGTLSHQNTLKRRTQVSTFPRKSLNNKTIPSYVITGSVNCDQCLLDELIHGFHHGENTDLCKECFQKFSYAINNKEEWIEFMI